MNRLLSPFPCREKRESDSGYKTSRFLAALIMIICLTQIPPFGGIEGGFCQDIHFSQFQQTPLLVNPALTGAFPGEHRVILNYRDQWRSVTTPYQTSLLSYDAAVLKKKWNNGFFGTGISLANDKAGDAQLGWTHVNLSLAGFVPIDQQQIFSAGIQAGVVQRSLNPNNLQWDNQYNGKNYDPNLSSGETNLDQAFLFGNVAAGLLWSYSTEQATMTSNDRLRINAGIAAFNLNRPKQRFYTMESDRLSRRYMFHTDAFIGLKNNLTAILPYFLFAAQGPSRELVSGAMFRYQLKEESKYTGFVKEVALQIGGYFRAGDAVIPTFVLEFSNFALGVSYDVTVSRLNNVNSHRGGMEISLRYMNPNPFKYGKGTRSNARFL